MVDEPIKMRDALVNNTSSNHSCPYWPTLQHHQSNIVMIAISMTTTSIALLGNLIITVTILRSRKLRDSIAYIFVLSVSVADLLVGIIAQPLFIGVIVTRGTNYKICTASVVVGFICGGASITGLMGITFDRFVYIVYPFKYGILLTHRRAIGIALILWSAGVILGVSHLIWFDRIFIQVGIFILIFVSSAVSLAANIRFLLLSLQKQKMASPSKKNTTQIQITRLILKISLAFGLCWVPYGTIGLMYATVDSIKSSEILVCLWYWSVTLGYSNSALNVLIYGKRNTVLYTETKKLLRSFSTSNYYRSRYSQDNISLTVQYHTARNSIVNRATEDKAYV